MVSGSESCLSLGCAFIDKLFFVTAYFQSLEPILKKNNVQLKISKEADNLTKVASQIISVFEKNKQFSISSEEVIFYKEKKMIEADKSVTVNDEYNNKYYSDNLISNDDFSEASAKNVKIRLKDKSRIVGSILKRKKQMHGLLALNILVWVIFNLMK